MLVSMVLAIGCGVLWIGCVAWTRTRGSRRAPVNGDVPIPEPVRLVLRHKSRQSGPILINATVLELADAGVLRIDPADSQRPAVVSPGNVPHASQLPDYQASLVARLMHRRGVSLQPVPLTALHPGEDEKADRWYGDFHRLLRRAAVEWGLLQSPVQGVQFLGIVAAGLVTGATSADAISHYWHASAARPAVFFLFVALTMISLCWACRARPTRAARALFAETEPRPSPSPNPVQNPDPSPRPATNTAPITVLPNQLQPLPAHQVWSDYGGSWHPLDTNTKETYAIRTGVPAAFVPLLFALISVGGLIFAKRDGDPTNVVAYAVFGGLPVILLVVTAMALLYRRHLPKRAVIRGQVAKLWTVRDRSGENQRTYYYCALDVGRGPHSVRLKTHQTLYSRLRVGEEVEVLVNPRRRSIKDIRFLGPAAG